ncbi:MAG: LLM class flavin-dependent oxidoreductase [Leptolyngbya sp.]|nr:LLM class flavin-dependent oxidoreductase [Candidatus Melainabacteria bacterium]
MANLSNTAFSVLDLAPVRAGKTPADALRSSLDLAQHVEKWGYKRFWLAEHHNMSGIASAATSVLIGYIAGGTSTIRVGSGGIMLPNHAPLVIAEQFGTLESLYPGRIDLGLGRAPGTDRATSYALRGGLDNRGIEFPELLAELQRYLGPATPGQRVKAYPGSGLNVPIWLLGSSDFSAKLAAEEGLPFAFASHFAPEELLRSLELYRTRFRPSATLRKPYAIVGVPLVAADTDDHAKFLATTPLQRGLSLIRGESMQLKPPVKNMDQLWSVQEKAAVESRMAVATIGGAETVRERLERLKDVTQADEFIFVSDLYDHKDRLRSFEIAANVMTQAQIKVQQVGKSLS